MNGLIQQIRAMEADSVRLNAENEALKALHAKSRELLNESYATAGPEMRIAILEFLEVRP